MTITIRKFDAADTDRIIKIWRAATVIAHPFQTAELDRDEALIRDEYMPQVESWVACDAETGEIAGFISLADKLIVALFVDPALQRGGVGGRLVAHVNGLLGPLSVEVFAENAIGVPFYKKNGFRFVRSETIALYPDHEQWIMCQEGAAV